MYLISAPPCPARFPLSRWVLTPCPPLRVLTPCPPLRSGEGGLMAVVRSPSPEGRGGHGVRTTRGEVSPHRDLRDHEKPRRPARPRRGAGHRAGRASGRARMRRTAGTAAAAR